MTYRIFKSNNKKPIDHNLPMNYTTVGNFVLLKKKNLKGALNFVLTI